MTVTYTHVVATRRGFGNFWRLLGRWRGGIYKVVIPELMIYAVLFTTVSVTYRLWIKTNENRKDKFEKWVKYCSDYGGLIPVSFVLGFFVAQIVTRWWNQYQAIPWPDAIAALVAATFHGNEERPRMLRRTLMRYVNLAFVMTMVTISPQAKARFPTYDHYVEAGFLFPHELDVFKRLDARTDLPKYWIPIVWAGNIAAQARREGYIQYDMAMINIVKGLGRFRSGLGSLMGYDWICIPLVYTQVVTLAVYLYFAAALFAKQFIDDEHELDIYVPVFLFLEFFFYTGWLKVAETMVNPFGEDDDDFEVNWLIDRNFTISLMIVDEFQGYFPELKRDVWWDEVYPIELPYTIGAKKFITTHYEGSGNLQGVPLEGDETVFIKTERMKDMELSRMGLSSVIAEPRAEDDYSRLLSGGEALPSTPQNASEAQHKHHHHHHK